MNRHEPKTHPSSSSSTSLDVRIPFLLFLSSRVWRRRPRGASDNKRWGSFVREHSAIDFLFSLFFFFLSLLFPCLSLWIRRSSFARYENEEREKRIYQELEGFAADIFRYEFLALTNLSVMGDFCIFFIRKRNNQSFFNEESRFPFPHHLSPSVIFSLL